MILLRRIGDSTAELPAHCTVLDITVKDNPQHVLSPTWKIVLGFKNGDITWKEYKKQYERLMEERFKTRKEEFIKLAEIAKERTLILRCYCPDENFCHRSLAKRVIERTITLLKEGKIAKD